jgi:hypothetical protein
MLVRRMVRDKIQDHPDPALVRFSYQPVKVPHIAEHRIDIDVIGDVVTKIGHWRSEDG